MTRIVLFSTVLSILLSSSTPSATAGWFWKKNSKKSVKESSERTPLIHEAIQIQDPKLVSDLIKNSEASLNESSEYFFTPLEHAAALLVKASQSESRNRKQLAKEICFSILDQRPNLIRISDIRRSMLLKAFIYSGETRLTEKLIKLYESQTQYDDKAMDALLEYAIVDENEKIDLTFNSVIDSYYDLNISPQKAKHEYYVETRTNAAMSSIGKLEIAIRPQIHPTDSNQNESTTEYQSTLRRVTPLMFATSLGQYDLVRILLEHGASPKTQINAYSHLVDALHFPQLNAGNHLSRMCKEIIARYLLGTFQ